MKYSKLKLGVFPNKPQNSEKNTNWFLSVIMTIYKIKIISCDTFFSHDNTNTFDLSIPYLESIDIPAVHMKYGTLKMEFCRNQPQHSEQHTHTFFSHHMYI